MNKETTVTWLAGDKRERAIFTDSKTVKFEPRVDPMGNLEVVKLGDEKYTVYAGDAAKNTAMYLSAHAGWIITIRELDDVDTD
jgi:hypothetical protein